MDEKTIARFWSKVDENGPIPPHRPDLGPCWVWTGFIESSGYGRFGLKRRIKYAHRVAWELTNGGMPEATPCVLHKCDNPPCCNPNHHFLGTRADNAADKISKGRHRTGKKLGANARAYISDDAVRKIRESRAMTSELIRTFGVSRSTVTRIRAGKTRAGA